MNVKRSRFLTLLAILAALAVFAASCGDDDEPAALTPVDFHISWLPGGDNLAFWMGVEQGFFAEEGLDVTIRSSNDPTLSLRLVSTGEVPLAQAYTGDTIIAAAGGDLVTSVFSLTASDPFGLISRSEEGIRTPEDLAGKTVGVTTLPIDRAFFTVMIESVGLTLDDVEVVDPGQGGIQQVILGNLAATSAVESYEPAVMEAEGITDYDFLYYSDYGAPDAPFFNIVAYPEWLEDNGDTVRAFLRAYRKAIEWTDANTDEAAELFVQQFPEQDADLTAAIWRKYSAIAGDGSQDSGKWRDLTDFLLEHEMMTGDVDVNAIVTDEYLP